MAFLNYGTNIPAQHWHPTTLALLREQADPSNWIGFSTEAWARSWSNEALAMRCAAHPELCRALDRYETWEFCHRSDLELDLRAYAAMAYGGANVGKGVANNWRLAESMPNLLPLLDALPTLTREDAYERFRELRRRHLLRGIGPSFFTKLMYFFGCPGAYILDQWLAKSILALRAINRRLDSAGIQVFELADGNGIRLSHGGKGIRDSVSGLDYEFYCRELEVLAEILGLRDGAEVERWLFSAPGSPWRQYLAGVDWTSSGSRKKARQAAGTSFRIAPSTCACAQPLY